MNKDKKVVSPLVKWLDTNELNLAQFAGYAGLRYSTFYEVYHNKRLPSRRTIMKMVHATERLNPERPLKPSDFGIYDYE